jgi:hypothetical protein
LAEGCDAGFSAGRGNIFKSQGPRLRFRKEVLFRPVIFSTSHGVESPLNGTAQDDEKLSRNFSGGSMTTREGDGIGGIDYDRRGCSARAFREWPRILVQSVELQENAPTRKRIRDL